MPDETFYEKYKTLIVGGGGIILGVVLAFAAHTMYPPRQPTVQPNGGGKLPASGDHDSPVEIAGSSIHVCSVNAPAGVPPTQDWEIAIDPADVMDIGFVGVKDPNAIDLTAMKITSGEWKISVSDGASGTGVEDAVVLHHHSQGKNVHVRVRDASSSISSDPDAIIFRDSNDTCSSSKPDCAYLNKITITPDNDPNKAMSGHCDQGKCGVFIGRRKANPTYSCAAAPLP